MAPERCNCLSPTRSPRAIFFPPRLFGIAPSADGGSHSHHSVRRQVGKMLLSSGNAQLGLLCYVPASKLDKCNASEWMKAVLKCVQK